MGKRILLCDDTEFIRLTLSNVLIANGYDIVGQASNGEEAIKLYDELLPDLVFMDIVMPKMDGISAVRAIHMSHPDANIIICSSMGQQTKVVEAVQAGAKDYIIKPFTNDTILNTVKKCLK